MKNYVKVFRGYDVPEGATHFTEFSREYHRGFFKLSDGCWLFANAGYQDWHGQKSFRRSLPTEVIELPEEPKSEWNGEGLPPVGVECEATDHWNDFERPVNLNDGQQVKILMNYKCPKTGTDGVIFTWIERVDNIRAEWTGNEKHFRPLKTEEEKKREAFIKGVKKLFPKMDSDDLILAVKLFDAGFTAPEGEL